MKKSSKIKILFLAIILTGSILGIRAGNTEPFWSKVTKSSILWQKVTPLGQLIACTNDGLYGIDVNTGAELWVIPELKNASESTYEPVSNSPFLSVSTNDGGSNFCIINPFEGKILFSSKGAGIQQVNDKYFLYKNNKILITGLPAGSKNLELVMVDMGTGKKLWSKSGGFSLTSGVKDLGNDEVLITSAFYAMKIKASTGDEIWKVGIDPKMANFSSLFGMLEGMVGKMLSKEDLMAQLIIPPSKPDMFVIAAQKKIQSTSTDSKGVKTTTVTYHAIYMAFNLNTGAYKWQSVIEQQYPLGLTFAAEQGLIVCSSNNGNINMLNYEDGTSMLGKKGKGLSLKGPASGMAPLKDGKILIASDNGGNSTINILDPSTGLFTFEKASKIKGVVSYTEILSGGILIGTSEETNLLNTSTGEWFFEKSLKGGANLIASGNDKIFIFNTKDGFVYQMNLNETAVKAINTVAIEFGVKEDPNGIEITEKGILLKSDQNIALMDLSGTIKFNKYFPAPGVSGFKKALLIASAVRAAYSTAALTAYSAAFGGASQSIKVKDADSKIAKDVTAGASVMFGEAAAAGVGYTVNFIQQANQRFKATSETPSYMLIMTAEASKNIKLVQVSKLTGEILNTIQIGKDKDPIYDVDMIDGKLYYMKEPTKMDCYKF
ncbi:MAG: PQQ-binding-like beta-propeller repeat protein [Bacteroidetes bacterium]|nr:PQQ-binding-like beta-propeller repeat protein [Bacteroidota bacterium]